MGPFVSVLLDLLTCCFFSGFMFLCFVYFIVSIGQCYCDYDAGAEWVPFVCVGWIVFLLLLLRITDNVTL